MVRLVEPLSPMSDSSSIASGAETGIATGCVNAAMIMIGVTGFCVLRKRQASKNDEAGKPPVEMQANQRPISKTPVSDKDRREFSAGEVANELPNPLQERYDF